MPPADAREKETSDSVDNELDILQPNASASTVESLIGQKSGDQIEDVEESNVDGLMEAEGEQED